MYHNNMTIKHRLFVSNIRMIFMTFVSLAFAVYLVRMLFIRPLVNNPETMRRIRDFQYMELQMTIPLLILVVFIIIMSLVNNYFSNRLTISITKPLEPLNEGVRQIHDSNFSYRIDYRNDDEFRPICDAFNEMAARLEISTEQGKKDEMNRRELIAGISHDLRTPLTSIKGYIEGLETGVASTPQMRENYFRIIKNKTADLEHIIEQLFLFSKLEMDEFPMTIKRIDLAPAITDMIEELLPEYGSRGLAIKITGMPENIHVNADVFMLRSVIINILENSAAYKTGERGRIEIGAQAINKSVFLRLADDGPGIHAEMLPKLFDAFYRTDPSRSRRTGDRTGSGLGLAISTKIIERMVGRISAELPPTGGLAIVIELPLADGE